MNFFEKFFGYHMNDYGVMEPYADGGGSGTFADWRHYVWMVCIIGLCVGLYQLFKRHKRAGRITVFVLCTLLFVTRLVNQSVRAAIGAEVPAWKAFPFHMCTVLTFVLPIVAVFQIKPMKTAVYALGVMGGVITVFVNDYFDNSFLTFSSFEGMMAHTLLILVPIIEVALGRFSFELKKSWQVVVGILILMGWATLANYVFFPGSNYMYLVNNALPGNIGGDYFFLVYVAIFAVFFAIIFGVPELYRLIRKKRQSKKSATGSPAE